MCVWLYECDTTVSAVYPLRLRLAAALTGEVIEGTGRGCDRSVTGIVVGVVVSAVVGVLASAAVSMIVSTAFTKLSSSFEYPVPAGEWGLGLLRFW